MFVFKSVTVTLWFYSQAKVKLHTAFTLHFSHSQGFFFLIVTVALLLFVFFILRMITLSQMLWNKSEASSWRSWASVEEPVSWLQSKNITRHFYKFIFLQWTNFQLFLLTFVLVTVKLLGSVKANQLEFISKSWKSQALCVCDVLKCFSGPILWYLIPVIFLKCDVETVFGCEDLCVFRQNVMVHIAVQKTDVNIMPLYAMHTISIQCIYFMLL